MLAKAVKRHIIRVHIHLAGRNTAAGESATTASVLPARMPMTCPKNQRKGLPRYPVPVALLGRLAVAESHQGKGFDSFLLAGALQRIDEVNRVMAVHVAVVDALNDRAAGFYQQFSFVPLLGQP